MKPLFHENVAPGRPARAIAFKKREPYF